jgi:glutaredoxin
LPPINVAIYPFRGYSQPIGDLMNFEHVAGKDRGEIRLFALSTCIWCKKTRELLSSMGVAFDYIYVDLLRGEERAEAIAEVKKYNPSISFPTLVVGGKSIVGLKEKEIREAIGK